MTGWTLFWLLIALAEAVVIFILISNGALDRAKAERAISEAAVSAEQEAESLAAKIKRLITKDAKP